MGRQIESQGIVNNKANVNNIVTYSLNPGGVIVNSLGRKPQEFVSV